MNELTTLHEAITASIKAAIPQFETVGAYATADESTVLPALLYAITSLVPGVDPGDGRAGIIAGFEARILVDPARPQAPLLSVSLAAQLTILLRKQFWALDFVEGASVVRAMPATTASTTIWLVQWQQMLRLGAAQWPWPDEPGPLAFAFSPDTGRGNEDSYQSAEGMT
ncbi:MAG: hypothetical protein RSD81_06555 [Pseudomonas sp.]